MSHPNFHPRRSVRLAGYDYAQAGAYFVTICTDQKRCVFGRVHNANIQLHPFGRLVESCWQQIPEHYPDVFLDEWIVMPNHLHGIIVVTSDSHTGPLARFGSSKSGSLATVLNRFKGAVTRAINTSRAAENLSPVVVWQSRFHDRIIRNEVQLNAVRNYIVENPQRWQSKIQDQNEGPRGSGANPV